MTALKDIRVYNSERKLLEGICKGIQIEQVFEDHKSLFITVKKLLEDKESLIKKGVIDELGNLSSKERIIKIKTEYYLISAKVHNGYVITPLSEDNNSFKVYAKGREELKKKLFYYQCIKPLEYEVGSWKIKIYEIEKGNRVILNAFAEDSSGTILSSRENGKTSSKEKFLEVEYELRKSIKDIERERR